MKEIKINRRRIRGCEPGQDSQPPNPQNKKSKSKITITKKPEGWQKNT